MTHTVHLLLGSELEQTAIELRKYVAKYGEGEASSYFAAISWALRTDHSVSIKKAVLHRNDDAEVFYSGLQNLYQVDLEDERIVKTEEEIKYFFSELYTQTVTISNPGDSTSLHLCIHLPLYDKRLWEQARQIIRLLNGGIQQQYTVDVLGIAADMAFLFLPSDKAVNALSNHQTMKEIVEEIALMQEQEKGFSHFIMMQNCNAQGIALNLDHDSFVHIVGEFALLCVEHYVTLFPLSADLCKTDFIAFGLSVLNFDKYYFVHYLIRRAYLYVMEREQVMQNEVDVNKVSQIAQKHLENQTHLVSDFYDQEVLPLLKEGKRHDDIVALITPKLDKKIETLSNEFQSFINDEELTLPEKQAALAQILGLDDDLLKGHMFNKKQLTIDDCDSEAANMFIEENNKLIHRFIDEDGNEQVVPAVLTTPEDSNKNIYLPLEEIKELRMKMRESTNYIRQKSKELSLLSEQLQYEEMSHKRLTENGFIYEGTIYKLLDIEEKPLTETYQSHIVSEKNIDLRLGFTKVKNQGSQGSCSVFSVASIYEYILKKSALNEYDLSEAFVYYNVREKSNKVTEDCGSSLRDVIGSIAEQGICIEKLFPYNPKDYITKPGNEAYTDAMQRLIREAKNVNLKVEDFKSALADGYPIAISVKIYDSFGNNNSGFIFRPTEEEIKSKEYGNHAMVVCGYSDDERVFIVRNSWGKDFGDKGYCYIPYSYIQDTSLTNMACIITQVSNDEVRVAGIAQKTTVSFNKTDNNIRCSIIRILIDEEKRLLGMYQQAYADCRMAYDTLMQSLGNNSIRERIYDKAYDRLDDEIHQLNSRKKQFIQTDRSKTLAEFDKTTQSSKIWIIAIIALLFITGASTFYFERFNEWFSQEVNWWIIAGVIFFSGLLSLYFPYRRHHRKKLEQKLAEQVTNIANRHHRLEGEQDTLHLQLHLAGMVIDRLAILQNTLVQRYQSMKSYVGNLSVWYDEENKKIKEMDAVTKVPFLSLLSNEVLDSYFERNKEDITSGIKLYHYFNEYEPNENTIRKYKNVIKQRLIDRLYVPLEDFTVYKYLMKDKEYSYLDPKYANPSQLLLHMDNRSEVFLQNGKVDMAENKPVYRYLFVHTDVQHERTNWEQAYPKYFRNKPCYESTSSVFKIVVVQVKYLAIKDVKMLNLM